MAGKGIHSIVFLSCRRRRYFAQHAPLDFERTRRRRAEDADYRSGCYANSDASSCVGFRMRSFTCCSDSVRPGTPFC